MKLQEKEKKHTLILISALAAQPVFSRFTLYDISSKPLNAVPDEMFIFYSC